MNNWRKRRRKLSMPNMPRLLLIFSGIAWIRPACWSSNRDELLVWSPKRPEEGHCHNSLFVTACVKLVPSTQTKKWPKQRSDPNKQVTQKTIKTIVSMHDRNAEAEYKLITILYSSTFCVFVWQILSKCVHQSQVWDQSRFSNISSLFLQQRHSFEIDYSNIKNIHHNALCCWIAPCNGCTVIERLVR